MDVLKRVVSVFVVEDRLMVTLFCLLLVFYGLETLNIHQTVGEGQVGPTSYPRVITVFGLILAAIFFDKKGFEKVELHNLGGRITSEVVDLAPLWMAVVYVALFEELGYITGTFLYITVTMKFLRERTWLGAAAYGAGITVLMFALFYYGLLGELPRGEWLPLHEWLPFIDQIRAAITE